MSTIRSKLVIYPLWPISAHSSLFPTTLIGVPSASVAPSLPLLPSHPAILRGTLRRPSFKRTRRVFFFPSQATP